MRESRSLEDTTQALPLKTEQHRWLDHRWHSSCFTTFRMTSSDDPIAHADRGLVGGAFASILLAAAIPTVDATAIVVAIPAIARDLHAGWLAQQWLLNASTLSLASLLLPAGMLGDRYGRRRTLRVGLGLVIAGAVLGAMSASVSWLLAARALLGAGGACVLPATIALVRAGARGSESRTQGFGRLAGWVGFGSALAPLLAGALIDAASWRAIFVLPAAPALIALGLSSGLSEQRANAAPRLLVAGALAGGVALTSITYAAIDAAALGFSGTTGVALFTAVAAAIAAWRALQHLPEVATISRNWLAGNAETFALYFGLIGLTYLLTTFAQATAGWSATRAAAVAMPTTLAMWLLSPSLGALAHRFGSRAVMASASALAGCGLAWAALTVDDPFSGWAVAPGTALFGAALALAAAPLTHAAVTSVSSSRAGLASAVNHAVVRIAGLAATISLGAVATAGDEEFTPTRLRAAVLVAAVVTGIGGLALVGLFRDEEAGGVPPDVGTDTT
jgi:MFS family permease